MLQLVYGDNVMLCIRVFEWHKEFKVELMVVKDDSGGGDVLNKQVCGQRRASKVDGV